MMEIYWLVGDELHTIMEVVLVLINDGNLTARGNYRSGIGGGYITSYSYGASGIGSGHHQDIFCHQYLNNQLFGIFWCSHKWGAHSTVKNIIINPMVRFLQALKAAVFLTQQESGPAKMRPVITYK